MSSFHRFEPSIKPFSRALTYHMQKFLDELIDGFNLWACLSQQLEKFLLFHLQILWLAEKEPGSSWCRDSQERIELYGRSLRFQSRCRIARDLRSDRCFQRFQVVIDSSSRPLVTFCSQFFF